MKFRITAGELAKQYVELGQYFFCDTLARLKSGYKTISSENVVEQFVKAKPERFYKSVLDTRHFGTTVSTPMYQKYFAAANPRLNLLKSIPPEHEFEMERIRKG